MNKTVLKMRLLLLTSFVFLFTISLTWGQSERNANFTYSNPVQALIDHDHLSRVEETVYNQGDSPKPAVKIYTIDREQRQIRTQLPLSTYSTVATGLSIFDEQWRKVKDYSYAENGMEMYEGTYQYLLGNIEHLRIKHRASQRPDGDTSWIYFHKMSKWDTNNFPVRSTIERSGENFDSSKEMWCENTYDKNDKIKQRITLELDTVKNEYFPIEQVDYRRRKNKRSTTRLNLKTNTKIVTHLWYEDDLLVRTKSRNLTRNETSEGDLMYENGLLVLIHNRRKTPKGTFEDWRSYSYE